MYKQDHKFAKKLDVPQKEHAPLSYITERPMLMRIK